MGDFRVDKNPAVKIQIERQQIKEKLIQDAFNQGRVLDEKLLKNIKETADRQIKNNYSEGYDVTKPEKEITTIQELKEVICKNFPSVWFETEACLSVICSLALKNLNGCPALILVGSPSGEKTTILSFFYGFDSAYLTDEFTPRAFVSQAANIKKEDLKDVDLLPRIKNKCMLTPELAPLFQAPKDELLKTFAILTRVLDGEGYSNDKGVHGSRGYQGDYKFCWLGATTPLRPQVWNMMGNIGNRLFFLNMREKNRKHEDYVKMFTEEEYEEKLRICRGAVHSFLNNFFLDNPIRSVSWINRNAQEVPTLSHLIRHAEFLAKLRGSIVVWKSEDDRDKLEYSFPIQEEPPRAINALRNFARGHALMYGRDYLNQDDIYLIKAITFSSMPHDRFKFLQLLIKHDGLLSTETLMNEIGCSDETARTTMQKLHLLGVVDLKSLPIGDGRPMTFIEVKSEFKDLIAHTQGMNDLEKAFPNKIGGVRVDFSSIGEALKDG